MLSSGHDIVLTFMNHSKWLPTDMLKIKSSNTVVDDPQALHLTDSIPLYACMEY